MANISELNIVYWDIKKLIGAEYNPRQLSEKQFKDLQDSIKRFGFQEPVIVNTHKDRKGIIISGHQRTRVAESLGIKQVPCVELSLTIEKEKELNIRMNKNTGEWDWDILANEFDADWLTEIGFEDWQVGLDMEDIDLSNTEDPKEDKPTTKSLSFKFDEVTYDLVSSKLEGVNKNKEEALLEVLEIEKEQ